MKLEQIVLSKIKFSKINPRTIFNTEEDAELEASIKALGVLEPILLRPVNGHLEVVAGERRVRATSNIAKANGGLTKNTIPAIVRKLTDNEAFEIMIVENLQRENLTDLDEAKGFQSFIKKRGEKHIKSLAEKIGKKTGYIMGRIAVMKLPKIALDAWAAGDLAFGHLQQLIRLEGETLDAFVKQVLNDEELTVNDLRNEINWQKPLLKDAPFDVKTTACHKCDHNTERQKKLFDVDASTDAKCMNPECYMNAARTHLAAGWKKTKYHKANKTNSFRFRQEIGYDDYHNLSYSAIHKECKACDKFITIIDLTGSGGCTKACLDEKCYNKLTKVAVADQRAKDKAAKGDVTPDPDVPRVDWHGTQFREKFYTDRLPEAIKKDVKPNSETAMRFALFALLQDNYELREPFIKANKLKAAQEFGRVNAAGIFKALEKMKIVQLQSYLKDAVTLMVLGDGFQASNRHLIAEHLKIDLKKEWRIDAEYLAKKHRPEILIIGHEFKFFEQQTVKDYLGKKYGKTTAQLESLKKAELVDVFLNSKGDLAGMVPSEILNT
jgi:ParB family chromosome partitioning protein